MGVKVVLNEDKEAVAEARALIKEHHGHCACALVETEDNKCMCKEFREQMARGEEGLCGCNLYKIIKTDE